MFLTHKEPSKKSVQERYMRSKEKHRDTVCENEGTCGNIEMVTGLDVLLEDLILEKEDFEESRERKEKNRMLASSSFGLRIPLYAKWRWAGSVARMTSNTD